MNSLIKIKTTISLLLRMLGAATLLFLLSNPGKAESARSVLVVAVSSDRSFDGRLEPLKFSSSDAEQFTKAMQKVGKIPRKQLIHLTNPTRSTFIKRMRKLGKKFSSSSHYSKLIFYYTGHSDARGLHFRDGALTKEEMHDLLGKISAETKVAILDSCFSGGLASKGLKPLPDYVVPEVELDEPRGVVFLAATSARSVAFESDELKSSLFTYHLVNGLYGKADANTDGIVTVDELYQYIYQSSKADSLATSTGNEQRPEFVADLKGRGAIALSYPRAATSQLKLNPGIKGTVKILSTEGLLSYTIFKPKADNKTIKLAPGKYEVRVRDEDRIGRGKFGIGEGQTIAYRSDDLTWEDAPSSLLAQKGYTNHVGVGLAAGANRDAFADAMGGFVNVGLSSPYITDQGMGVRAILLTDFSNTTTDANNQKLTYNQIGAVAGLKLDAAPSLGASRFNYFGHFAAGQSAYYQTIKDETTGESAKLNAKFPKLCLGLGSTYRPAKGLSYGIGYFSNLIKINTDSRNQWLVNHSLGLLVEY